MKILYILALALLVAPLQAQTKFLSLHGGPKFGGIILLPEGQVWFTDKISTSTKALNGYAGAFLELRTGKYFAVQVESLVSQFAYHWKIEPYTIVEKYSFISLPVITKFRMGGFSIYGGYQWDKLNFAERKMNQYGPADPYTLDKVYEYDWHSANLMYVKSANSILAGIEYTTRMGLGFSARYVKGLTNIVVADRQKSVYESGDEIYNTYLSVGAYWSFGKRRQKKDI